MPTILFTADPKLPRDLAHLGYRAGMTVDLPADQCERWIRRGVARHAAEAAAAKPEPQPASDPAPAAKAGEPAKPARGRKADAAAS